MTTQVFSLIKLKDKGPGRSDIILVHSTPQSQDLATPSLNSVSVDLTLWEIWLDKCFFHTAQRPRSRSQWPEFSSQHTPLPVRSLHLYIKKGLEGQYVDLTILKMWPGQVYILAKRCDQSLWPMPFSFFIENAWPRYSSYTIKPIHAKLETYCMDMSRERGVSCTQFRLRSYISFTVGLADTSLVSGYVLDRMSLQ